MPSTFHLICSGGIQSIRVNHFAYSMASLVFKLELELKNLYHCRLAMRVKLIIMKHHGGQVVARVNM